MQSIKELEDAIELAKENENYELIPSLEALKQTMQKEAGLFTHDASKAGLPENTQLEIACHFLPLPKGMMKGEVTDMLKDKDSKNFNYLGKVNGRDAFSIVLSGDVTIFIGTLGKDFESLSQLCDEKNC